MVTWSQLLAVPAGLSIEAFPFHLHHMTGALFRVQSEMFVIGTKSFSKTDPAMSRHVNTVLWATEADELSVVTPPVEMLLRPDAMTYSAVLKAAKKQGLRMMESASYRIARDGKFVTRDLEARSWRFYFRLRDGDEEQPFAIMRTLRQPASC